LNHADSLPAPGGYDIKGFFGNDSDGYGKNVLNGPNQHCSFGVSR